MAKPRKYQPLVDYLATQSAVAVTPTFVEIEELIGAPLPRTVAPRIWWHTARPHWRLVRAAGWRVAGVDVPSRRVTFARVAGS